MTMIIIDPFPDLGEEEIVKLITNKELKKIARVLIIQEILASPKCINIVNYNNKAVITCEKYVFELFSENRSELEKRMTLAFPKSKIFAFYLASSMNGWGYLLTGLERARRIRDGNADDGVTIDLGIPVKEEEELFSNSVVNKNGLRKYSYANQDYVYTEDQMGEEFVFNIIQSYLGKNFFGIDFSKTYLTQYTWGIGK